MFANGTSIIPLWALWLWWVSWDQIWHLLGFPTVGPIKLLMGNLFVLPSISFFLYSTSILLGFFEIPFNKLCSRIRFLICLLMRTSQPVSNGWFQCLLEHTGFHFALETKCSPVGLIFRSWLRPGQPF